MAYWNQIALVVIVWTQLKEAMERNSKTLTTILGSMPRIIMTSDFGTENIRWQIMFTVDDTSFIVQPQHLKLTHWTAWPWVSSMNKNPRSWLKWIYDDLNYQPSHSLNKNSWLSFAFHTVQSLVYQKLRILFIVWAMKRCCFMTNGHLQLGHPHPCRYRYSVKWGCDEAPGMSVNKT
jgi:hypothetical protein